MRLASGGFALIALCAAGPVLAATQADNPVWAPSAKTIVGELTDVDDMLAPAAWDEPTCGCDSPPSIHVPLAAELPAEPACGAAPESTLLSYYVDYDRGFVLRPFDPRRHPFELKISGWIQFRHHGFARNEATWTDSAGVTREIRNRNVFDVERGRLVFSGFAIDQRLTYFLQLDGDSDGGETVDFFDYWCAWQFNERINVQAGKRKVPGSRQWLLTARDTRFVDRPMACDFFRSDRTTGLFAVGPLGETGRYEAMIGNGYRTANLPPDQSDNRMTFAWSNYWDPRGDYGGTLTDDRGADAPLWRIGHSMVYSRQEAVSGLPVGESDFIRLTDGTRLTAPGALAPGTTVSAFDVFLYGIDAAVKYRGWSANGEVYCRWLENLEANAPLPTRSQFQRGWYVEGGRYLIPRKWDVNVRCSQVLGSQGNATEVAVGMNWFPLDTTKLKVSWDVSTLDGSPLQNTSSDILVGDDGVLMRTQLQAEL
ncbi:MAG: porin [Planctomycetaceae bacterium]|nr:porin [Planctomycetaceae bacterium]